MSKFNYTERLKCICSSNLDQVTKIITKETAWGVVNFVKCRCCGTWCQAPQIDSESLANWYDSDKYQGGHGAQGSVYNNYILDEQHRQKEAEYRFKKQISKYLTSHNSKVLEIGCATGSLLSEIKKHGHDIEGIDLSEKFVSRAKELYGIDVKLGNFDQIEFDKSKFDLILMFGTASNLLDPHFTFRKINSILKKDAHLIVNIPVVGSFMHLIYKDKYWMFTPSVNNFMTEEGFINILIQAGFSVLKISNDWQLPSLQKVLTHTHQHSLLKIVKKIHLEDVTPPVMIPIPGVKLFYATKITRRFNISI